jgi:4-amino-4-deoxy-L-arabinose transferase-like glycosyltransferase
MNWIKRNRLEFVVILLILLIATFLRFYRLADYMTFLGDEGRDGLVVRGILVDHHVPLLGPPTSVGNMYLGPLYYYMMALPMAIFWMNPVAAAGQVAVIGILTVGLVYYLARSWFGRVGAFCAGILYTVSPVTVIYSRSSWNPNPAPFFSLLAILGLYKAHQTGNFRWFVLTGMALAFAVQMHYLALILLPIYGLLWLNELRVYLKSPDERKFFVQGTMLAVVSFLFLMSPLLIFDFRHNFINYKALTNLFSGSGSVGFSLVDTISRLVPIYQYNLVNRHMAGQIDTLSWILSLLILLPILRGFKEYLIDKKNLGWHFWALGIWLLVGLLGLTFYKQQIYDHYVGFLNPVPFLLLGSLGIFASISKKYSRLIYGSLIFLTILLSIANLLKNPFQYPPNRQLEKTQNIARFIIQQTQNKPFNFALLSEHNYDAAYQFYLGQFGHPPLKLPIEKTDQLWVVCEDPVCRPIGNPKHEIAAFGWAKIESEQAIEGVRIFKLVSNPDQFASN